MTTQAAAAPGDTTFSRAYRAWLLLVLLASTR